MGTIIARWLTDDETGAWQAATAAKLKALRRAWERATDDTERARHLLAALALCWPLVPGVTNSDHRVPAWLHKALCAQQAARLRQVEPTLHWVRWLMVREAHREGLTWPAAREAASARLADTPWAGGRDTMKTSHDKVQRIRRKRPPG